MVYNDRQWRHESYNDNDDNDKYIYDVILAISTQTLTHWGLVMPFGDIDLGQHWLR